jgi:hypothetical protein
MEINTNAWEAEDIISSKINKESHHDQKVWSEWILHPLKNISLCWILHTQKQSGRKKFSLYLNDRQYGYVVSCKICQLKALVITKEIGILSFNTSWVWLKKFFKWDNSRVKWQISIAQRIPNVHKEKILTCHNYQYRNLGQWQYQLRQQWHTQVTVLQHCILCEIFMLLSFCQWLQMLVYISRAE